MKIKSIKIILALLTLTTCNAFAQRFKPGFVAGVTTSDVVGIDPYDNDFHKAGFTLGGLLNTQLSDRNSFQFEILYVQKGSLQPADSANNYNFYKLSLDYIEVPILLKHKLLFNINKKPVDRFYFEIGPSLGKLIRINVNSNGSIFNSGNFRKNEIAINLGIGGTIVNNLDFNIRYTNSIISVVEHPEQINSFFWYTFNKGDNVVFSFTLRYIFDFGKKE